MVGCIYTYTVRASVSESVSEPLTELCLHYIQGSDLRSSEVTPILVETMWTGGFEHAYCSTSDDFGRPRPKKSPHIVTSSDMDVRD